MKNTLIKAVIWAIAMLMPFGLCAQTDAKRAFRIHLNDGSVEFFFYSDVLGMNIGYADDNLDCPQQIIQTADSVYTYALEDIDSVSFARPATVYKDNVVKLNDGLRNYALSCDSLTVTFRSDVPRNLFPPVGGYLVTLDCDDTFPSGFIGKLASLNEESGTVVAQCEEASALDVFDKLFICMGEESTSKSVSKRAPDIDFEDPRVTEGDIRIGDVGTSFSINESLTLGDLSGGYTNSAGFKVTTPSFHVRAFFLVENGEIDFSMITTGQHVLSLNASVGVEGSFHKDYPLIKVPIRLPYAFIPAGSIDFGLYFNLSGMVGVNASLDFPFSTASHYAFGTKYGLPIQNSIPNKCFIQWHKPNFSIDVEGSAELEFGGYGSINFYPSIEEIGKLSIGLRTGVNFSSETSLTKSIEPIENCNTELYDELNRDDYFRADWLESGYISLSSDFFNYSNEQSIKWYRRDIPNPFWTCGIVPEFYDLSLEEADKTGSVEVTSKIKRSLAFGTKVGFALYDRDKQLIDTWWCPETYKKGNGTEVQYIFSNLKPNEKYTVHPLVSLIKLNMVANPSTDIEMEEHIITGKSSNTTENQATLSAQVNVGKDNSTYQAGFCYYAPDDQQKWVYVEDSGSKEIKIDISDLEPNTEYSYFAYLKIGDYEEYGETMKFRTAQTIEVSSEINDMEFRLPLCYGDYWESQIVFNINEIPSNCIKKGIILYHKDGHYSEHILITNKENNEITGWISIPMADVEIVQQNYWASTRDRYSYRVFFDVNDDELGTIRIYSSSKKPITFDYKESPSMQIYNVQVQTSSGVDQKLDSEGEIQYEYWFNTKIVLILR